MAGVERCATGLVAIVAMACVSYCLAGEPATKPAGVDAAGDPLPASALARVGTQRFRHGVHSGMAIAELAISANGKRLATRPNLEQVVQVWDADTGRLVRTVVPAAEQLYIRQLRFVGDDETLAALHSWYDRLKNKHQVHVAS